MSSNTAIFPTSAIATEVVLPGLVETSGLYIRERALLAPHPGEVLIPMKAAGTLKQQMWNRKTQPKQSGEVQCVYLSSELPVAPGSKW